MTVIMEQSIEQALKQAAGAMTQAGDHTRAAQAGELGGKLTEGRLTVALCGHFSAGKSTLVNQLCGAKLLPSSPIPTSANVVSIRGGARAYAEVEKVTENGFKVQAEVPIDGLAQYCTDGEHYTSVSIVYPSELLGNDIVLLDTPGIDSTDDAHRMATESALHLADVVFYVMDYNHVQSEINFAFAKELKDWGKPLYFIVNQIDKHRERELRFADYRRSVEEAFQAWHLEPAGIVYLSLREPNHPHHEWEKLIHLIKKLAGKRLDLCAYSVDASLRHLVESHLKWRDDLLEPERERLLEEAGGEEAAASLAKTIQELKQQLERLAAKREQYRGELRKELQSILDNANVTPAGLRDLAQSFLESRKPGFKAGLFGSKTAAEQVRRLDAFRTEFNSLVGAGIDWHVKQLLRNASEQIRYDAESLERLLAEHLSWTPGDEWLIGRVKQGAVFGNEYTMTYSRELAADAKSEYRQRALEVIDELAAFAAAAGEAESIQLKARLAELMEQSGSLAELEKLNGKQQRHSEELRAILPMRLPQPELPAPEVKASLREQISAQPQAKGSAEENIQAVSSERQERTASVGDSTAGARSALAGGNGAAALSLQRDAASRLLQAAELIASQSSLRAAAQSMREKAARLSDSQFTVALFGAFSAGKSSLANALIGDAVLPVSPNPTTAAINRLLPPKGEYGHAEARVMMKSRDAILSDLRYSLALLGENATESHLPDAGSIMRAIDKLSPQSIGAGGRPHYSFLRAARAGWDRHEPLLGKELKADRAEYAAYVAEESRSCFVSEIDFHYDCALTAEGIVLVDTPGADSVNARHTGVAFNYIKNADAVLFVTYYNHAFSQADRQFLDQLGRVKDQFELDKMFFIVNAADLAADEEELRGVLSHVESNLKQHAIRSPRLYPVSSIQALDGKMDGNGVLLAASRMEAFETAFLSFIQHDLGRLAADSASQDLNRVIGTVANWLKGAQGDAAARQSELEKLKVSVQSAGNETDALARVALPEGVKQEIRELLYYVVQRVMLRFGDFYHLAFNPSTLQDDGRDLKRIIWTAWLELQRLLQRELSQELLATTLRVEKASYGALRKQYDAVGAAAAQAVDGYSALPYEAGAIEAPDASRDWEMTGIDAKWLWSRFKSPRQFFEGNGKTALRKELEALIGPALAEWSGEVAERWLAHYASAWSQEAARAGDRLKRDLTAYADGRKQSLADSANVDELNRLYEALTHI
ncbi:dynamin family protein [Paenibacillus sp. SCIV0701]|uniref:Dynamin family protein n=1 Tax=Paenibacillus soyae TaxID=2969249 RepID=A0A9X2MJG2_9BACL|nr:dynamin family protein [Paenibacillus soyae]MCR2802948.1 dynamin family protein [Paenibacillus soyae]